MASKAFRWMNQEPDTCEDNSQRVGPNINKTRPMKNKDKVRTRPKIQNTKCQYKAEGMVVNKNLKAIKDKR